MGSDSNRECLVYFQKQTECLTSASEQLGINGTARGDSESWHSVKHLVPSSPGAGTRVSPMWYHVYEGHWSPGFFHLLLGVLGSQWTRRMFTKYILVAMTSMLVYAPTRSCHANDGK